MVSLNRPPKEAQPWLNDGVCAAVTREGLTQMERVGCGHGEKGGRGMELCGRGRACLLGGVGPLSWWGGMCVAGAPWGSEYVEWTLRTPTPAPCAECSLARSPAAGDPDLTRQTQASSRKLLAGGEHRRCATLGSWVWKPSH